MSCPWLARLRCLPRHVIFHDYSRHISHGQANLFLDPSPAMPSRGQPTCWLHRLLPLTAQCALAPSYEASLFVQRTPCPAQPFSRHTPCRSAEYPCHPKPSASLARPLRTAYPMPCSLLVTWHGIASLITFAVPARPFISCPWLDRFHAIKLTSYSFIATSVATLFAQPIHALTLFPPCHVASHQASG